MAQPIYLVGASQREFAKKQVDAAPPGWRVLFTEPTRTLRQNDRMHAMLADIRRHKCEGRVMQPEQWKHALLYLMGHEIHWLPGLEDSPPFPAGFRTSRMSVRQMSEFIDFLRAYGDRHGVLWTEPQPEEP